MQWDVCGLVCRCVLYVGAVKRSDCILVYGSTTKDDVVKRSDCILLGYESHYQGWCCKEVWTVY